MSWPAPTEILLQLLPALAVVAVALGMVRLGLLQYALLAPGDADAVPLLHLMAILGGALLGLTLLAALPHLPEFSPGRIYAPDSPWATGLGDFLARYALPDGATLAEAAARIGGARGGWPALLGQLGLLLVLGGVLVAARLWRGWARLRAAAAVLVLAGWTALTLHYGLHLLAWGAAQLGFWLFLLLLLLWQRWRYARTGH